MTVIFGIIYFNEDQSFKIFEYLTNKKFINLKSFLYTLYHNFIFNNYVYLFIFI